MKSFNKITVDLSVVEIEILLSALDAITFSSKRQETAEALKERITLDYEVEYLRVMCTG